jgi:sugar-specific transcriptional regulator TrmB
MSVTYSIFDMDNDAIRNIFGLNTISKDKSADFVQFTIVRAREKRIHISIHKDQSLWDFYEKCYFTIYPDINREQFISREPAEKVPHIYDIFMHDEKTDEIKSLPIHRFITLSDFMKCSESYFIPNKRNHIIYVIDEKFIQRHFHPGNKEADSVSSQITKTLSKYNCLLGQV